MNVIFAILVLGILGAVFGVVLAAASQIFAVKKDPREEAILGLLAGANCGGCGYPGCAGCAAAIVAGDAPVTACAPAGADNAAAIAFIMGIEVPKEEKMVAYVRCNGGCNAKKRYQYVGIRDCLAASKVAGGPLECGYGCLGCGSCVEACRFGALQVGRDGVAVVDPDKCTHCMACAKTCPRGLIVSVPVRAAVYVACANKDPGLAGKSVCEASCIGCGLCQKECRHGAIYVENNVAVINYDKCRGCGNCAKVCPRSAIDPPATEEEKEHYKAVKRARAEKTTVAAETVNKTE